VDWGRSAWKEGRDEEVVVGFSTSSHNAGGLLHTRVDHPEFDRPPPTGNSVWVI